MKSGEGPYSHLGYRNLADDELADIPAPPEEQVVSQEQQAVLQVTKHDDIASSEFFSSPAQKLLPSIRRPDELATGNASALVNDSTDLSILERGTVERLDSYDAGIDTELDGLIALFALSDGLVRVGGEATADTWISAT